MDSSFISEWSVTSLFLFLSQSSIEIAKIVTVAMMMINIATVTGIFLIVSSAVSSSVSPHAFAVSKGAPVLQEEEVLGLMVDDGVTEEEEVVGFMVVDEEEEVLGFMVVDEEEEVLGVMVADAAEGAVGVDDNTTGLDDGKLVSNTGREV